MNIYDFGLKDTLKEYDSDFLLELSKAFLPNNDAFSIKYNLRYAGELAERFIERDIVKNSNQLITLIDVFCNYFPEDKFQLNQKQRFLENIFEWLNENETTDDEKLLIKAFTIKYILYHFDSIYSTSKDTLKSLITEIKSYKNSSRILITLLILFKTYKNIANLYNSNDKDEWLSKIRDIIIVLLNNSSINLKEYELEEIRNLAKPLLEDTKNNVIKSLDLKVKDFKSNKNNLNLLKALKRLINSEMTEEKLEKDRIILGLSDIEILYLNIRLSNYKISYNSTQNVTILLLERIFKANQTIDKKILETSISGTKTYEIRKIIGKYYNKDTNKDLIKFYVNALKPSDFSSEFLKNLLLEKDNLSLINEENLEKVLSELLNNVFKNKEEFDYFYTLFEETKIATLDLGPNFQFNLFKFGYIDIFDKTFIEKNNMQLAALNYIKSAYGDIARYLYVSHISFKNNYISLGIERVKFLINDTKNFKELSLVFQLTDNEDLSIEEYKFIVAKNVLHNVLTYHCLTDIDDFTNSLFTIIKNKELYKYLDLTFDELTEIRKMLFESDLLEESQRKIMKEFFQEKTGVDENKLLIEIDNACSNFIFKNYEEFFTICKCNFNILKNNKVVQDKILYILENSFKKQDLSSLNSKDMWLNYSLFYFFSKNQEIDRDFESSLLEVVNSFYLFLN